MNKKISIIWFRQDLRLSDNLAIEKASNFKNILPIYILDDCAEENFKLGDATKVYLHNSLSSLNKSLSGKLNFYLGSASKIISHLASQYQIENIFCNACFEPWHIQQEIDIEKICKENSINFEIFNSNYLWHPNDILKDDKSYYKVFTPYKNRAKLTMPREICRYEKNLDFISDKNNKTQLDDLNLLPHHNWFKNVEKNFNFGENSAQESFEFFLKNGLNNYKEGRNHPAKKNVSKLSPSLHFGEISPVQIWHLVNQFGSKYAPSQDTEHFISEIIWREFSCYLLFHFKTLHKDNFDKKFDKFPWKRDDKLFNAWKKGLTGYPFIDAGMRELWETGYIHNRPRMAVASFLVKNLGIHWHFGRDWFWNCLFDADLANNSASWQWVAGCGADAAPYFRVFNPSLQGIKFDKEGEYIRKFVPELKNLPDKYIVEPWNAPKEVLHSAGLVLGRDYPYPIVDLAKSRDEALEFYKNLNN